jgi:cytochrome c biogenesis protein CcmG, thiol:disulfide interchange protein DsbE
MQPTQRRAFYAVLLLAGLIWILLSADRAGTSTNGRIPAPQEGFLAPDFSLETLSGETYTLSTLRGSVVVVNLWASWCPPCRAEMPAIQHVYEKYKGEGLVVLAVNATSQDNIAAVDAFIAEHGLTFPVVMDTDGKVASLYHLSSLPTTFFIGRDGMIREVTPGGPISEASLRATVETLLAEAR